MQPDEPVQQFYDKVNFIPLVRDYELGLSIPWGRDLAVNPGRNPLPLPPCISIPHDSAPFFQKAKPNQIDCAQVLNINIFYGPSPLREREGPC
jgi:hypothetical protein